MASLDAEQCGTVREITARYGTTRTAWKASSSTTKMLCSLRPKSTHKNKSRAQTRHTKRARRGPAPPMPNAKFDVDLSPDTSRRRQRARLASSSQTSSSLHSRARWSYGVVGDIVAVVDVVVVVVVGFRCVRQQRIQFPPKFRHEDERLKKIRGRADTTSVTLIGWS